MLRPVFLPLIFGLIGTAILVSLGVWQLQRLTWKQGILSNIEARISADPVAIPDDPDAASDKYLPVRASGDVTADEIHVLVSQKRIGAGYRIISAFQLDDGRRIMLDRGFVAADQKTATRPMGAAQVTGNLHWPEETGSSIPEPDKSKNIWFARDVTEMAETLGALPILVVARDRVFDADPVDPLPVDTTGIPNDHLQYALTWFSLAAVWLIMTLAFIWRGRSAQKGS